MTFRASGVAWLAAFLALAVSVAVAENDVPREERPVEVRGLRFGASEAEIRRKEKAKFVAEKDVGATKVLLYSDSLFGSPVFVRYRLVKDSLYEMSYGFDSPGGCSRSLKLFDQIKGEIASKYGGPESKDLVDRRQCLKMATWHHGGDANAATIVITLDGSNYSSKLDVFYSDTTQKEAVATAQKEHDQGKL